jgi:hypothetical protein
MALFSGLITLGFTTLLSVILYAAAEMLSTAAFNSDQKVIILTLILIFTTIMFFMICHFALESQRNEKPHRKNSKNGRKQCAKAEALPHVRPWRASTIGESRKRRSESKRVKSGS